RWVNRVLLFRPLRRWMAATGFRRPIAWTFLPTPTARDLIREVDPRLVVYYCADDFAASSHAARRIAKSEQELFTTADFVFATSQKLMDRAAQFTTRVHRFPAGVNFDKFAAVGSGADAVPGDLKALGGPIAGYVGALHVWLDQDLVAELARRMPDVSFALVGPTHSDTSRLAACENVHLLGGRPHELVPSYIKGFDAGLVPYRNSEYTASVYPVKLNEYLAMGVPVVATDLPEIRLFNAEHGGIVAVAGEPETFTSSVEQALGATADADVSRRVAVARENSWETRIARMGALIEAELATKRESGERWEYVLRRLYRRARRRLSFIAGGAALVYLLL